jgi:hypothetical protein
MSRGGCPREPFDILPYVQVTADMAEDDRPRGFSLWHFELDHAVINVF